MSILNKKQLRKFVLEVAQERTHKFTRVGKNFFLSSEYQTRKKIREYVLTLPSKGKTIN